MQHTFGHPDQPERSLWHAKDLYPESVLHPYARKNQDAQMQTGLCTGRSFRLPQIWKPQTYPTCQLHCFCAGRWGFQDPGVPVKMQRQERKKERNGKTQPRESQSLSSPVPFSFLFLYPSPKSIGQAPRMAFGAAVGRDRSNPTEGRNGAVTDLAERTRNLGYSDGLQPESDGLHLCSSFLASCY